MSSIRLSPMDRTSTAQPRTTDSEHNQPESQDSEQNQMLIEITATYFQRLSIAMLFASAIGSFFGTLVAGLSSNK